MRQHCKDQNFDKGFPEASRCAICRFDRWNKKVPGSNNGGAFDNGRVVGESGPDGI